MLKNRHECTKLNIALRPPMRELIVVSAYTIKYGDITQSLNEYPSTRASFIKMSFGNNSTEISSGFQNLGIFPYGSS